MKLMAKAIHAAQTEGKVLKKHLHKFLLNYQATPYCTTKCSPAELLFNQKIKKKLPQIPMNTACEVQYNDKKAKGTMESYADAKRGAKPSQIKIDDLVLACQRKQNCQAFHTL